jgi:hypothetical protein
MDLGLRHIFSWQAGTGALVGLFLMTLKQMSGHRPNGKYHQRPVKQEEKRKQ